MLLGMFAGEVGGLGFVLGEVEEHRDVVMAIKVNNLFLAGYNGRVWHGGAVVWVMKIEVPLEESLVRFSAAQVAGQGNAVDVF